MFYGNDSYLRTKVVSSELIIRFARDWSHNQSDYEMRCEYKAKVMQVLKDSKIPMDIENVRTRVGMRSWLASKSVLLELLYEGEIAGEKTTKSWIFWAKRM